MNLSLLQLLGKSLKGFSLLGAMVGVACLVETTQFGRFGPFVGNEQADPLQAIRGRGASPPATLPAHDRDSRRPSRSSWARRDPTRFMPSPYG